MPSAPEAEMPRVRVWARVAGALYLVIIVCGIFAEVGVRGRLIVPDDAAATAEKINANTGLFRVGFLADAMVFLSDAALAAVLYILFRPVSMALSAMAAAFRLAQTAILGLNLLNYYAAILILNGSGGLEAFSPDERNALALLFLTIHKHGYDLGLLFFGAHCIVLGYLIVRSGFVPALLGALMGAAGVVYLAGSLTLFLFPAYVPQIALIYVVPVVAEIAFCLWLLIKGVRPRV